MFFRNLTLFRFDADTAADLARLDEALAEHPLRPCGPLEMWTHGFVPPLGRAEDAALTLDVAHCKQFCAGGEDKLLPAAVLNEALRKKVDHISEQEGRKVGGRERKRLKEDLLTEMLPRAFTQASRLQAYVDTKNGWLVMNTASRKQAEHLLTMTREALGSFPAIPLAPEEGPRVLMTDWLANGSMPAGLALGDECELRDPATATGAIAMCRRQDMDAEEIKEHLRNGKQVFKLGLVFDERISFVLSEDLIVRKLKFLDVVVDELGSDHEDAASEFASTFALMSLELQRLLGKFEDWFGLQTDAPLRLHRQDAPAGMRGALDRMENSARERGGTMSIEHNGKVLATFGDGPDPLYDQAVAIVTKTRRVSISGVQRQLRIGYNRAARLIEQLEADRIVSTPNAQGVRAVLTPPS